MVNVIVLFPLFQFLRNSTLLYPFKKDTILRRTSSGFSTFALRPSNVYIVTFATPWIFLKPLVENQHFHKTMQILVVFHHFQWCPRPNSKNFKKYITCYQNRLQNPLQHLRFFDYFLIKSSFSICYTHISNQPKPTI